MRLNGRLGGVAGTVPNLLALDAGGDLTIAGTIAASTGPTTLALGAAGAVAIVRRVVARSSGDTLTVTAADRVDVAGRVRVPAVDIAAAGDVSLTRLVRPTRGGHDSLGRHAHGGGADPRRRREPRSPRGRRARGGGPNRPLDVVRHRM
jgi:hypothetical protein